MPEQEINYLIISFLTNDISDEELRILQQWLQSDKANVKYFDGYVENWLIAGAQEDVRTIDTTSSWELLKNRLNIGSDQQKKGNGRRMVLKYYKTAASWLIFFMLGFISLYLLRQPVKITPRPVVVEVPLGAKSTIVLPDGSKVWLNAGTRLTYDENYGKKTRSLVLSGEAYFDVASDKMHPFIVNALGLRIKALGTKFNVKAYPEEPSVMTTLEEGKIDIHIMSGKNQAGDIILLPDEKFIYQKESGSFERTREKTQNKIASKPSKKIIPAGIIEKHVNTELYTSWKDKRWIIEAETLDKLAPMLERKYNVKIIFSDEMLKYYSFTGTIEKETIEQIMNAIQLTAPIDFELNRDTVILTANRSTQDQFKQITKPDSH